MRAAFQGHSFTFFSVSLLTSISAHDQGGDLISLSEKELDLGLEILKHHGYGDFFPRPPEFDILSKDWASFRKHLGTLDLGKYEAYQPIEISAPKSRINLRRVALLHPFDAVIYSSLVGLVRDSIADDRVPESEKRVFSFRSEGAPANALYKPRPSHPEFAARVLAKATKSKDGFIALADVADFYRRLYQHRVRNAVEATIKDPLRSRYAEIIEKRLLRIFSSGNSYGIPIGPAASRPLAEAAMIDVDSALQSHGIDFVRYIDDFALFGASREAAEWSVRQLGEILLSNHGLALQTAKTHVMSCAEYVKRRQTDSEEDEVEREFNEIVEEHFYDIDSLVT
jgi:Reverse transcriptase (RNA-dependent DNA polymerase)